MQVMKNKSVDGLRGIAALNVVVAHFFAAFMPSVLHKNYPTIFESKINSNILLDVLSSPFFTVFYNGHFAVLIFFLLSGYVLTIPYFTKKNSNRILEKRLWARYFRLSAPIFLAVLISFTFYFFGFYWNVQAANLSGSTSWLGSFFPVGISLVDALREGLYKSIILGQSSLVPPLWTLKVEFIGSLYVLLFYISKPERYLTLLMLIVFILIYVIHGQDSIYYYAIFIGSILNLVKKSKVNNIFLFAIGMYFGGFQFKNIFYDFLPGIFIFNLEVWDKKTFYNLIGAFFITFSIIRGYGDRVLTGRLAQFLGKISYSIYLIHFIVVCSLSSFLYVFFPLTKAYLIINFFIYIIFCCISSYIFQRYVDNPTINSSHRFSAWLFKK